MGYDNIVIAFAGCARCGKTTSAEYTQKYIKNVLYEESKMMSFAGPLKRGLNIMGVDKEKDYDLYRELAQQIGTNYLRTHDNDWWVDLMKRNIAEYFKNENESGKRGIVVIDDVRFQNESFMVNEMSHGINVFVYGGAERIDLDMDVYKHASEYLGVYFEKISRGAEIESITPDGKLGHIGGVGMDNIVGNMGNMEDLNINIASLCQNIFLGKTYQTA